MPWQEFRTVHQFVRTVLPAVERQLDRWRAAADRCPDPELRRQALASLQHKRFHAQGGAAFALQAGPFRGAVLSAIVALQTISDYLDNLCDRAGCLDETAFRHLHRAMTDALAPGPQPNYYAHFRPTGDQAADGGYLTALVGECRQQLALLPSFPVVRDEAVRLVELYNDLQVYKHLAWSEREHRLMAWFGRHRQSEPQLSWWEFAAATGSTLGIFALFAAAARPGLTAAGVHRIVDAYFPWICGLHILLDYFIDQSEDKAGGDLNFVRYYPTEPARQKGLHRFTMNALAQAGNLPAPGFHRAIVRGLLALYLSDPKVGRQGLDPAAGALLAAGGLRARWMHRACRALRRRDVL